MQETYLHAYNRLHTFRRESTFTTWLYAIEINLARAALRRKARYSVYEEEDIERLQPTFVQGAYVEPFEALGPAESRRAIPEPADRA